MLKQLVEMNARNIAMIVMGKPFETEEEQRVAIKKKFNCTIKLLNTTLIYYGTKKSGRLNAVVYYLRMALAYIITANMCFGSGFVFLKLVNTWGAETNIAQIVMLSWLLQVCFIMLFLLYWQHNGYVKEILKSVHFPNESKQYSHARKSIQKTMILSMITFILCILFTIGVYVVHHFHLDDKSIFNLNDFNFFVNPKLIPLVGVLMLHGFYVWNIVITFFVIVNRVVLFELRGFNKTLRQVGSNDKTSDEIGDKLLALFITHIEMSKMIKALDNAFEVFIFVMIGANIPTTIFSILTVLKSISKGSAILVTLALPGLFFSGTELIGLTAVPAKLYATIREVESILYCNTKIWIPFDERVYQIADAFVSHVKQGDLGISLWGFAIVTKPLILTTISVIATYLSLLIEMDPQKNE